VNGLILGHRGSPAELPENTMPSFRRAREVGADGVELDVRVTADGVPIVIHDDTVDRTTTGTGSVSSLTWPEIAGLRVRTTGSRDAVEPANPDSLAGERVPMLEEVVRWAEESGAFLDVELKAAGAEEATLELLRSAGLLKRSIVSSFIPSVVEEIGRLEPSARRYLVSEYWDGEARHAFRSCGAGGVCIGERAATSHVLAELARDGIPFMVWTVDDPIRIRAILAAGAEAVITNVPARGVAARAQLGSD
jgi:glycerophosphoryl diester phosphodiesterase